MLTILLFVIIITVGGTIMATIIGETSQEFYQHFQDEQKMMQRAPERFQKAGIPYLGEIRDHFPPLSNDDPADKRKD